MRAIDLDFQPRPVSFIGLFLLVAGLLAFAAAIMDYRSAAAEVQARQSEQARLQQPRSRPATPAGTDKDTQQVLQAAGAVAQDIRRPWGALFAALESCKTDDVALLTLSPDATRGVIRITGEAKQREAVLAFVERLGQQPIFKNVFLVEDQVQQQAPEKPVRFLLSADWVAVS